MLFLKRWLIVTAILTAVCSSRAVAQDSQLKDFTFEDVPTEEAKPPYFAAAGGFLVMPMFQDLAAVNQTVGAILPGASFNAPLWLFGGQGFVAIGIVPNLRLGVFSAAGSLTNTAEVGSVSKRAEYGISMTGFSVDYAFMPAKGLALLPGVNLGFGTVSFEASQSSGMRSFGQTFPPAAQSGNFRSSISANHFFVQPTFNIEYAFSLLTMVRLNAGYSLSFVSDWRVDRLAPISNVPASFNASGLTAQIGIFVGIFSN
jgi:hypothetical protein